MSHRCRCGWDTTNGKDHDRCIDPDGWEQVREENRRAIARVDRLHPVTDATSAKAWREAREALGAEFDRRRARWSDRVLGSCGKK